MIKLSISGIVRDTTVDGTGFRTSVYAAGCTHQCAGCHNPHSWDIANGKSYSVDELLVIIKEDEFSNVTFSGGDPLMQVDGFTELAKRIKKETSKNIWCYTGFTYEQILKSYKLSQILPLIDVLVDGRYIDALRNTDLQFRGSSNQRIIDVQKTLSEDRVIIWTENRIFIKQQILNITNTKDLRAGVFG
ncbi:MAG: anaerobic ribonucleoside-triphosphate reductase activating protein [Prevotella sp.]|jgi:anaerobic ribonucleoside-triphosphate reductase activating protein|nr:anaerobic ribonucleoside-triphosphate reductase activating protein [Prevotella sp.]